jgi:HAD superfamily hydrolase (TIGR01490 family)
MRAAFFDLDRTLLRRSSALALAKPFRARGLISRGDLARAAFWQLLFVARGATHAEVRKVADRGLTILEGMEPGELARLVEGALEPVLRPLLVPEVVAAAEELRAGGHRLYIVSTALQEIVDALAADLRFDGGLGTIAEIGPDGRYTGRALRALHGAAKVDAVRQLAAAEGIDLAASVAYSDGYSDLPLLKAVGRAVAVNPDRKLRRVASERGYPILEGRRSAGPHPGPYGAALGLVLGVGAALAARRRAD